MANLSGSEKWRDDWFLSLGPIQKLVWQNITDKCDSAGFMKISYSILSFEIGAQIAESDFKSYFGDRILWIKPDEIWICGHLISRLKKLTMAPATVNTVRMALRKLEGLSFEGRALKQVEAFRELLSIHLVSKKQSTDEQTEDVDSVIELISSGQVATSQAPLGAEGEPTIRKKKEERSNKNKDFSSKGESEGEVQNPSPPDPEPRAAKPKRKPPDRGPKLEPATPEALWALMTEDHKRTWADHYPNAEWRAREFERCFLHFRVAHPEAKGSKDKQAWNQTVDNWFANGWAGPSRGARHGS